MLRTWTGALVLSLAASLAVAEPAPRQAARTVAVKTIKPPLYLRAQIKLKELGDYTGPISGKRDHATIVAIKRFQSVQHLPVSGHLTPETVKALGV
jgi:peptidoglycan hydrolase-like protein with peptidoglycan-binding domain